MVTDKEIEEEYLKTAQQMQIRKMEKADLNHYCMDCGASTTKIGVMLWFWLPIWRIEKRYANGYRCDLCYAINVNKIQTRENIEIQKINKK